MIFFILPKCLVIITDFGIIEFEMQQLRIHVKCNSKSSVTQKGKSGPSCGIANLKMCLKSLLGLYPEILLVKSN